MRLADQANHGQQPPIQLLGIQAQKGQLRRVGKIRFEATQQIIDIVIVMSGTVRSLV